MSVFKVRRGDIFYADLPEEQVGSVQAGRRPVVITQSNWLNRSSPTVIIAFLTSRIKNADMECHFVLPMLKGLPLQTMVLGEQRFTIETTQVNSFFGRITEKAGVPVTGQHALRHTFATRCIEAGVPAVVLKKWLGHTDIHITLDTYADVFARMDFSATDKFDDLMENMDLGWKKNEPQIQ